MDQDYIEGQFRLAEKRLIWWPVRVRRADPENPGAVISIEIELLYRVFTRAEADAFRHAPTGTLDAALRSRIEGWRGKKGEDGERPDPIVDAEGNAVEFTPENLSMLLDIPAFYEAAMHGLWQATAEVPVKNS